MKNALLVAACAIVLAGAAHAKVFYAKSEALKVALPTAETIQAQDIFLTDAQKAEIEKLSGEKQESALVTVYVGWAKGQKIGYAIFDTHTVRTHPETFVVALDPSGKLAGIFVCAFYEPLDYLPSDRFLAQFNGRDAGAMPRVGSDVVSVTGATLSARAVAGGVRKVLAIHRVCLPKAAQPVGE